MKILVVLSALTALCAGNAIPTIPGDNSHYVEGESRYIWMPDGDGVPHLVDLHGDEEDTNDRDGSRNEYWLFTRNNRNNHQVLVHGDANSVSNSNFDRFKPLAVIVHGWNSNGNSEVNTLIRDAYLDAQDINIIVVDWRRNAGRFYSVSVRRVPSVGEHLGKFLMWLVDTTDLIANWNNVHLIGFSLGAHVVGNAGRTIRRKINRITGLDPAGPLWGKNDYALKVSDAAYVEAIHTDGGRLGIMDPIGFTNFYPNGGRNPQPGCRLSTCSHSRVYELYAVTITQNRFQANKCADLNEARRVDCSGPVLNMGNGIINKRGPFGLYALTTEDRYPF